VQDITMTALPGDISLLAGVIVTHANSRFFGKSGYDLGQRQPISNKMSIQRDTP